VEINRVKARIAKTVEAATVRMTRLGGQGVLVPGNMILTAAHCIRWTATGAMALGDQKLEAIETRDGQKLIVDVLALEPVADIAVLGAVDGQALPPEAEAYEEWCEATTAVKLYIADLLLDTDVAAPPGMDQDRWAKWCPSRWIAAHVLTHDKGWIDARAHQQRRDSQWLTVEVRTRILGGTSGGSVIADNGRLLGVISHTGESFGQGGKVKLHPFPIPRPHRTLPVWVVERMRCTR
jgi:hypothetical protein